MKASKNTVRLTIMGMLTAIILIMAFTPLGYLKIGIIEITFLQIPIIIGSIILGPVDGAILGGIFGLTSFIQCFGSSPFGTVLLGINPFFTFIVCMIPRILMGWLSGIIFQKLNAIDKTKLLSFGVSGLSAAFLNTTLFVGALVIFFFSKMQANAAAMGKSFFMYLVAFVGLNGVVEAIVCTLLGAAIGKAVYVACQKYGLIEKQ